MRNNFIWWECWRKYWVGLLMWAGSFGWVLAEAAEAPSVVEKILSRLKEQLAPAPRAPVPLVVDDPWQAVPRVGRGGLRPVQVWLEAKPRQL